MPDLFGFDDPAGPPKGSVALALVLHDQTDAAWLLAETNDRRDAKWAPKSKVKRGEGCRRGWRPTGGGREYV